MGNDYENERNKRIALNKVRLASLGLGDAKQALQDACHVPKQAPKARAPKTDWEMTPSRRSDRAACMPKVDYQQETTEGEAREYVRKQQRGHRSKLYDVDDTTGPGFAYVKVMMNSLISGGYWAQAPFGLGQWLPNRESMEKTGHVFAEKEAPKANIVLECGGEEWDVVWMNRSKTGDGGGFSGGWRGFAIDQRLAAGDAVVFKKEEGLVLRVNIYRSWLHKSSREATERAFDHADVVMARFEAGEEAPVPASCSTQPSKHCHSRRSLGRKDAGTCAADSFRARADPDMCLELARAEQDSLMMTDDEAAAAPPGIKHTPASQVCKDLFARAEKAWPRWQSEGHENGVKFETRHTYAVEEQIVVVSGRAVLTPQNSCDEAITVSAGDVVRFGRGLRCEWLVEEPMVTRYVYLDDSGKEMEEEGLTCDVCQSDCWERSWLINDQDLCDACHQKDPLEGAEYQEQGQPAELPTTDAAGTKRAHESVTEEPKPAKKKQKTITPKETVQVEAKIPFVVSKPKAKPQKKPKEQKLQAPAKQFTPPLTKSSAPSKETAGFGVGTQVWAKLPGWPAWPAKMSSAEAEGLDEEPPKPGHLLAMFYGETSYQWLPASKLKLLVNGAARLAKLSKSSNKDLHHALEEAIKDQ